MPADHSSKSMVVRATTRWRRGADYLPRGRLMFSSLCRALSSKTEAARLSKLCTAPRCDGASGTRGEIAQAVRLTT